MVGNVAPAPCPPDLAPRPPPGARYDPAPPRRPPQLPLGGTGLSRRPEFDSSKAPWYSQAAFHLDNSDSAPRPRMTARPPPVPGWVNPGPASFLSTSRKRGGPRGRHTARRARQAPDCLPTTSRARPPPSGARPPPSGARPPPSGASPPPSGASPPPSPVPGRPARSARPGSGSPTVTALLAVDRRAAGRSRCSPSSLPVRLVRGSRPVTAVLAAAGPAVPLPAPVLRELTSPADLGRQRLSGQPGVTKFGRRVWVWAPVGWAGCVQPGDLGRGWLSGQPGVTKFGRRVWVWAPVGWAGRGRGLRSVVGWSRGVGAGGALARC
jgi:hypothetical protein